MLKAAIPIALLTVFFAPGALAEGESSEVHTIVGAGTAQGAALWSPPALRQSYGVSVMRLSDSGQGFGARLSLLPSSGSAGMWEASADAMLRVANDSPWYFKGLGGIGVGPQDGLWPPRLHAGVEVGLTAIRGGIGLEAGVSVMDSFPPARPLEGQLVVSVGMGILFGFGAPPPAPPGPLPE